MQPEAFYHLSDRDVGALIAYIRSLPYQPNEDLPPGGVEAQDLGLLEMIVGGFWHGAYGWTPNLLRNPDPNRPRRAALPSDGPVEYGAHLTQGHCARCHNADLQEDPGYRQTPDVALGAAYPPEQFERLIRDGLALGDREVGHMTTIAKENVAYLTDAEIQAIHTYQKARASEKGKVPSN